MKILYVIDSLASRGGAERIVTEKMNYLSTVFGHEVTVVCCYQDLSSMPNAYELSPHLRQVCLAIPYYSQYRVGYPRRLWVKWCLRRQLVSRLTKAVANVNPDILVGMGYFAADVVCGISCHAAKVIESHDARPFTLQRQGLSRYWFSELYMQYFRRRYFHTIERSADVVVALTKGDAREWHRARRVEIIPNFSVMPVADSGGEPCLSNTDTPQPHRVLAVGRLEWQKGFDLLLDAWATVAPVHPQWRLDIIGSGSLEQQLNDQIASLGLTNVTISPFTPQIAREYARSTLVVLSSRFEGFSLVLLEAMRHGVPCVSFDCPFGPSDVLADGICGLLARNGDTADLAAKLTRLMDDEPLRRQFSAAALERAKIFDTDIIMAKWDALFKSLLQGKN